MTIAVKGKYKINGGRARVILQRMNIIYIRKFPPGSGIEYQKQSSRFYA